MKGPSNYLGIRLRHDSSSQNIEEEEHVCRLRNSTTGTLNSIEII